MIAFANRAVLSQVHFLGTGCLIYCTNDCRGVWERAEQHDAKSYMASARQSLGHVCWKAWWRRFSLRYLGIFLSTNCTRSPCVLISPIKMPPLLFGVPKGAPLDPFVWPAHLYAKFPDQIFWVRVDDQWQILLAITALLDRLLQNTVTAWRQYASHS